MTLACEANTMRNASALENFISAIEYRVARNKEELQKAYGLVYKEYLKKGYTQENNSGLRLSIHNALPQATTFVAVADKEIFATATLVPDSPLGLPMDELYSSELNELRKKNIKLCEITMLASDTSLFRSGVSMMLNSKKLFFILSLFKVIYDYARYVMGLNYMCITINPKHKLTYDFLLFKDLGQLKTYDKVCGAPAVAQYLDLCGAEDECKKIQKDVLYNMFFGFKTPTEKFSEKFMFSPQDLKHFFVENSDTFKKAPPAKIEYLMSCYPSYNFSEITK